MVEPLRAIGVAPKTPTPSNGNEALRMPSKPCPWFAGWTLQLALSVAVDIVIGAVCAAGKVRCFGPYFAC